MTQCWPVVSTIIHVWGSLMLLSHAVALTVFAPILPFPLGVFICFNKKTT